MNLNGKKIILGSQSPRRKELLSGLDVEFTVDTDNSFEENFPADIQHKEIPVLMSEGKSKGFHRPLEKNEILITSDTMVFHNDEMMGKPHTREEALQMIRSLSDSRHQVITAVTIRDHERMLTFTDCTDVWFGKLKEDEISYYVDTYLPYDKAGAYGIQEWIGYMGITRIEGSFFNVMGFPTQKVYENLITFIGI